MRNGFVIHHNGPPAKCVGRDHTRCIGFWVAVKHYHVATRGWSDIAYSFGVCPHGTRFEGRGWVKSQWANGDDVVGPDNGRDREWFTVLAFIGEDANVVEEPTPEMVDALRALISQGRQRGYCGLQVLPHNAFKVKKCPGDTLTALANQWDGKPLTTGKPQEDDMTPEESKQLDEIHAALVGPSSAMKQVLDASRLNGPTHARILAAIGALSPGSDIPVAALAAELVDAMGDDLAAAVANELGRRLDG